MKETDKAQSGFFYFSIPEVDQNGITSFRTVEGSDTDPDTEKNTAKKESIGLAQIENVYSKKTKVISFDSLCRAYIICSGVWGQKQNHMHILNLKDKNISDLEKYLAQNYAMAKTNRLKIKKENLKLFEVKEVKLEGNSLSNLPDSFAELAPHLTKLSIAANNFIEFPPVIYQLTNLMHLKTWGNKIDDKCIDRSRLAKNITIISTKQKKLARASKGDSDL